MTDETALALIERVVIQRYEFGAQIVREGEIGDADLSGLWHSFGEQALIGRAGGRRAATGRATGPVTVARITSLYHLLHGWPGIRRSRRECWPQTSETLGVVALREGHDR